jgi:hypothetical protein
VLLSVAAAMAGCVELASASGPPHQADTPIRLNIRDC